MDPVLGLICTSISLAGLIYAWAKVFRLEKQIAELKKKYGKDID